MPNRRNNEDDLDVFGDYPPKQPRIEPRYGNRSSQQGGRPARDNGPAMRGVPYQEQMQGSYNGYDEQGYQYDERRNYQNQEPEEHEPKGKKEENGSKVKNGFRKFVTLIITLIIAVVVIFGGIKLVKVFSKDKATETTTTQTTKNKTTQKEGALTGGSEEKATTGNKVVKKEESIQDIGGTKDSSAKERLDTKSIESEVYSNTATVKTVELISTGKLTASYHFVFEMGSTTLDMYLNEFEAENLKVGDKVKISFKKIPSKDKVVITDIQRA